MKKSTKNENVRKIFVRNGVVPARSCEVIHEKKRVQFTDNTEDEAEEEVCKDFSLPEPCSILKLADEIKKVRIQDYSENRKGSNRLNKKSFNLNYQPDEKLYKDLISLDVPCESSQVPTRNVYPSKNLLKKDPEPNFKEILKYSLQPGYTFTKFVVPKVKKPLPEYDGRSIYNLTKKYDMIY